MKSPSVFPRSQTIRQRLLELLQNAPPQSAKALSKQARVSEKDVFAHLEHLRRSVTKEKRACFVVVPAECRQCGYLFEERKKLAKPSRCPSCRKQSIEDPLFAIE